MMLLICCWTMTGAARKRSPEVSLLVLVRICGLRAGCFQIPIARIGFDAFTSHCASLLQEVHRATFQDRDPPFLRFRFNRAYITKSVAPSKLTIICTLRIPGRRPSLRSKRTGFELR